MDLKRKVYETIKKRNLLSEGKNNVVLGFSGGPDSLALFNVLLELSLDYIKSKGKFGYDISIYPVHINHNLRGVDSLEDEKFAVEFSKTMHEKYGDIVSLCSVFSFDCLKDAKEKGITTEEAGRNYRYLKFREVAKKYENSVIAVAQNANDQAETILFRIIRGTGLNGLEGIPYERYDENVKVIRPLLDSERSEIEIYNESKKLSPRIDKTNLEDIYMRNKIRLNIIPLLKELNPNIVSSINRLGDSARINNMHISKEGDKYISELLIDNSLDVKKLKDVDKAIRLEMYLKVLKSIGMNEDVTKVHLEEIDSFINPINKKSPIVELSHGFRVTKEKGKLIFQKK